MAIALQVSSFSASCRRHSEETNSSQTTTREKKPAILVYVEETSHDHGGVFLNLASSRLFPRGVDHVCRRLDGHICGHVLD